MKSFKFIFFLLFGFLLLNACDTERDCPVNPLEDGNQVKFQATIGAASSTRASGTEWDTGDAIGVYALTAGATLPSGVYDGKENIKYTTPGTGTFTAATAGISFPETGALDFVAYYPYKETIANYTYNINVANQSNSAAIDLLYSNDTKGVTKENTSVNLTFKHILSMLVLNITAGDGVASLDGLTASIRDLKTDGTFNIANGTITLGSTSATITPAGTVSGTNGTVAAILVPGQDLNSSKVTFSLAGKVYEWIPESITLESGKRYTYSLQLSTTGVVMLQPEATIVDWEDADTGTGSIILTPEEGNILTVSPETIQFEATSGDTKDITIITSGAWTATTEGTGFTVSPATGTGNATVTATATTASGASGKVIFTLDGTGITEEVTVSQKTSGGTTGNVLFPGSDFENWSAFMGSLNSFGLKAGYTSQSNDGRNGSKALYLNGTPTANDYVFTAVVPEGFSAAGKTKIVFYIKGTSAKSLSLNVYVGAGSGMGIDYKCYNLGSYSAEGTILPTASNSYTGTINTGGNWMKVTLDINGLTLNSTAGQNLFALKAGSNSAYDLLVDDITLE